MLQGKAKADILTNLDEKIDHVFRNRMLMTVYESDRRNYGTEIFLNELEAHILGYIDKKPGITAKELCMLTYRSKPTISNLLSRLEGLELIKQQTDPRNLRNRPLFLSEEGKHFSDSHRLFDRKMTMDFILYLSEFCTQEEIEGYFKVTQLRREYFERVINHEKTEYANYLKNTKKQSEI